MIPASAHCRRYFKQILLLLLSCVATGSARAQVTTGTILGSVQDASHAAVSKARITAQNLSTGLTRTVYSSEDGGYAIPFLPIGNYSLQAELAGFETETISTVRLDINAKVRVDFLLRVGKVTEKIAATSTLPVLDTQTAETGEVIGNVRVTQLPLNGRQFIQLAQLTPGAVPEVKGTLSSPLALSGMSVNTNGTRYEDNMFLLDGVSIRDEIYERLTVSPSVDSIEEFKVHSSNYSAEFGGHGGAQVNISTKSGTNEIHGTAYEFLRNDALDAKNFFDLDKPHFRQNQFGFSLGAPIRKNRTFFFGNYEGSRIFKGITITCALPTEAMREGDFTGLGPIIDPENGQPFTQDRIPADRIADFAKAYLAKLPPTTSPGLGRNFAGFGDRDVDMNQFTLRLDHSFSNNDQIFGRFAFSDVDDLEPFPATVNLASGTPPPASRLRTADVSEEQKPSDSIYAHLQSELPERISIWVQLFGCRPVLAKLRRRFPH